MKTFIFLLLLALLSGCSKTGEGQSPLTPQELKTWSKALAFPTYCAEGAFEGDVNAPELKFYTLGSERLVSAVCESFSYQNVVNLYRVGKEPSTAKVVDLFQIELNLNSISYYDEKDRPLKKPLFTVSFYHSPQVIHQSLRKIDPASLEVTRFYNDTGSCGSVTLYDFSKEAPAIISFQLEADCESETKSAPKAWPRYEVLCTGSSARSCSLKATKE